MTSDTIRVRDPQGKGWTPVKLQAAVNIQGHQGVGALIQVDDSTMPQAVPPEFIHPEDRKVVEDIAERKSTDST